jgi:RHH-type proline utilization regulon transcriptional repressor/proline dehydrogenase/delta 1-pyrroline-5-carboxylate dehydrogenase
MNPLASHGGARIEGTQVDGRTGRPLIADTPLAIEPLTDFSRAEGRRAMQTALEAVAGQLGRVYPLVVNNQPVSTPTTLDSLNPSHRRQVVGRCGRATPEQARDAVAAAVAAFPGWRDTKAERRADYLVSAAQVMKRRRFELAAWQVYECGKQWREADADVAESIDYCHFYAQEMRRLARPRLRNVPGEDNSYFYEPRGVAVVIAPWNFPLAILCGMTTAALVTGNTVLMKPAEQSAVIGAKLMEIFQEVGLPPGVAAYLPGVGEEIGPTLVDHPNVALIAFTGSRQVGLHINREAAEVCPGQDHVKRVIAEMGGKNAILIDDDADMDEAVHGVAASAFGYQGQKCSACSRVLVPEAVHDAFLARLIEATRSLKIGPAEDPGCHVGPVIDEEAYQRILATIEKGKGEARLAFAGDVGGLADEGYYVAPHIFADVAPSASLAQEEIFGPVLAVLRCRDLDHALEIANGTRYALTGGFFSRSPEHIARVKREFRVGNLYINRKITGALVDRQPFGGFKLSGIGSKAGGPDYLLQFVLPRTITENTLRRGFAPSAETGLEL